MNMVICGWRPATDSLTLLSSAIARNYSKQARRVMPGRPSALLISISARNLVDPILALV